MNDLKQSFRTCDVEGCDNKHEAKGYCKKHLARFYRHGDPLVNKHRLPLSERIGSGYIPVTETGCWLWEGYITQWGYGRLTVMGRAILAHRLSYEYYVGPVPKGKLVLHKCDTPACINPNHLYIGTDLDNSHDAIKRNRRPYKLTIDDLVMAKKMHEQGLSYNVMAPMFDVTPSGLSRSIERRLKRHYGKDY